MELRGAERPPGGDLVTPAADWIRRIQEHQSRPVSPQAISGRVHRPCSVRHALLTEYVGASHFSSGPVRSYSGTWARFHRRIQLAFRSRAPHRCRSRA